MPKDENINALHVKVTNKWQMVVLKQEDFMKLINNATIPEELSKE